MGIFDRIVLGTVVVVIVLALFGPLLAPYDSLRSDIVNAFQPPSAAHWFGTDQQGRDVLSRLLVGGQISLLSSVAIVALFALIGVIVATTATLGGRWVDQVLMRAVDVGLALPGMVLALGLAAALGPSVQSAIIALGLSGWPATARLLRTAMAETMAQPYIEGAKVLGVPKARLLLRHIWPNAKDVLVVQWTMDVGVTIVVLASLSFLGVGAQPPTPEWGAMLTEASGQIGTAWWTFAAPAATITVTAFAFGLLGEMLQMRDGQVEEGPL
ncbi:MAG: ABC transporter permease [Candidatus Kaistia colombiensis]|nr:MAG: ABC transporter permease [Kaistia sp.]